MVLLGSSIEQARYVKPSELKLGYRGDNSRCTVVLAGKITSSELGQALLEDINSKASQEAVDELNEHINQSVESLRGR